MIETAQSGGGYKEVLLFLVAAAVVVPLFHRGRISPVLGFLAAGVAIGPFGFGALDQYWPMLSALSVDDSESIGLLAEFGVVFLLFTIGLELSWDRLRELRMLVFGLGGAPVFSLSEQQAGDKGPQRHGQSGGGGDQPRRDDDQQTRGQEQFARP